MLDIVKELFNLAYKFINALYYIEIDLLPDTNVYLGRLVIAFIFSLVALYLIFKAIGVVEE